MNDPPYERATRFRKLHDSGTFSIANAWDGGSAKILQSVGFAALATSSGAAAATLGRYDGRISLDEALAHAKVICAATSLPVSADLEKGFADSPADVARTIRLAAGVGLVGGSIEDFTGDEDDPIFDLDLAAERIAAAAEAARSLPFPFMLTARAENFLHKRYDLEDTIRRLQAYEKAGADVLFAPALPDLAAIRRVCASVAKPVNFHGRGARAFVQRGRAGRGRRAPHQLRDDAVSRRDGRARRRRARDPRRGHVRLHRARDARRRSREASQGVVWR
jgi:2-methylisocitrate lyase-like PEP mutase family enzyme